MMGIVSVAPSSGFTAPTPAYRPSKLSARFAPFTCSRASAGCCSSYEQIRAFASVYEQLRAFTSVYEQIRVFTTAPGCAKSRLVAFSRANSSFFTCSGPFGRFLSYLVISCRHFTSQYFSGMAGNGRLQHRLGREGSSLLRMVPAPGGGCEKWHGIHLQSVCSCGRAAAALVRFAHNCTTKSGRLHYVEIPGGISEWGWVSELL